MNRSYFDKKIFIYYFSFFDADRIGRVCTLLAMAAQYFKLMASSLARSSQQKSRPSAIAINSAVLSISNLASMALLEALSTGPVAASGLFSPQKRQVPPTHR
jgi:hypothetical protein